MTIIFETSGFPATDMLRTYVEKKFGTIGKILGRFEAGGDAEVRVEVKRTTRHHKKGDVYEASADFALFKKKIHVAAAADDARKAVDEIRHMFRAEIEKYKERMVTVLRKKSRK